MATAEEILLAAGEEKSVQPDALIIDNDLRTIAIPEAIRNLGVEDDDDVKRLHFKMPRTYGEFDLGVFAVHVVYVNANNEPDMYLVTDAERGVDEITFSWLVGENALKYRGETKFAVHLRRVADGKIVQRFNTEPAKLKVLEGLDADITQEEEEKARDIITQLISMLNEQADEKIKETQEAGAAQVNAVNAAGDAQQAAIENKAANALASIPADYTALAGDVSQLKETIGEYKNYFNAAEAHDGYFVRGNVGSTYELRENATYACYVFPVEVGKTYVAARTDYMWLELDKDGIILETHGNSAAANRKEITPVNPNCTHVGLSWAKYGATVSGYMILDLGMSFDTYIPYPGVSYIKDEAIKHSNIEPRSRVINIGKGKDYESVIEAFRAYANDTEPKTFKIHPGTYDIFEEYGGAEYLATITAESVRSDVCAIVPENSKIVGVGDVILEYLPQASDIPNDAAVTLISALDIVGSVEVENITIRCMNCRYGIHDESGAEASQAVKRYKNVKVAHLANTYVPSASVISGQAYGCGFNDSFDFEFDNCIFQSDAGIPFTMHNRQQTNANYGSSVNIRNSVFVSDNPVSVRFGSVWTDVEMNNRVNIHSCYMQADILLTREAAGANVNNQFTITAVNSNATLRNDFTEHGWTDNKSHQIYNLIA